MLRDRMDSLVRSVYCNVGAVGVILIGVLVLAAVFLGILSAIDPTRLPPLPLPDWAFVLLLLANACSFVYWQRQAKHHCSTYWDRKRRERRG